MVTVSRPNATLAHATHLLQGRTSTAFSSRGLLVKQRNPLTGGILTVILPPQPGSEMPSPSSARHPTTVHLASLDPPSGPPWPPSSLQLAPMPPCLSPTRYRAAVPKFLSSGFVYVPNLGNQSDADARHSSSPLLGCETAVNNKKRTFIE